MIMVNCKTHVTCYDTCKQTHMAFLSCLLIKDIICNYSALKFQKQTQPLLYVLVSSINFQTQRLLILMRDCTLFIVGAGWKRGEGI